MPRSLASCYENLTAYPRRARPRLRPPGPGPAHRARIRTRLQNAEIADIFLKKGLHEFLTDFIADNGRLGAAITEQYLT